jgi:hypothetical protein
MLVIFLQDFEDNKAGDVVQIDNAFAQAHASDGLFEPYVEPVEVEIPIEKVERKPVKKLNKRGG